MNTTGVKDEPEEEKVPSDVIMDVHSWQLISRSIPPPAAKSYLDQRAESEISQGEH